VHHQWLPDEISVEYGGLSLKTVQALERQGYRINFVTKGMGDVQAIARSGSGWIGVSDTRSIGKPMGY
jgi:gamma-glutamyltranspeptidase